jgi:thiamine biosynthesis lipoprotein
VNLTSFKKELFGKEIEIIIYDVDIEIARDIIEEAYKEALRLQKKFNFFDGESELSILNKKRKLKVSDELLKVIKRGLEFSKITNGKYDIAIGKRILQRKTGLEETEESSYKDIEINGNDITLKREAMIDLGSIAKGYITDRIADFLKSKGVENFIIDSRGDIIAYGNYEYLVEIQHPRKKNEKFYRIKIKNGAVATSGDYNQFYGNFEKSHIINSGEIISLTVVANTLEEADVYSTALFVADEEIREKMIKNNKGVKVLMIMKDLKSKAYNKFKDLIK